jgi:uncharacterized cupin superfamily protein
MSLALVAAFSLSSLAVGPEANSDGPDGLMDSQAPSGTLTSRGHVTINGNPVKTGATILSGSLIITGGDAFASVDMAGLGRLDVHLLTEASLFMGGSNVDVSMYRCGAITQTVPAGITGTVRLVYKEDYHVKVMRGQVTVKYDDGKKEAIVKAGENKVFKTATEVVAVGDSMFKIYCAEDTPLLMMLSPALGALIPFGGPPIPPFLTTLQP